MQSFFDGWRRKAGVVALGLACILMVGWARSYAVEDAICFPTGDPEIRTLVSVNGEIGLMQWYDDDSLWPNGALPQFSSMPIPPASPTTFGRWIWSCCGVGVKGWAANRSYVISYWSLTLPLTLLSAYLILWKSPGKARRLTVRTCAARMNLIRLFADTLRRCESTVSKLNRQRDSG